MTNLNNGSYRLKLIYIYTRTHEQHQKPPWRDLVFGFMWGTPRESKTSTRESSAKASRKECVKVEPRKQRRKQVDSRSAFKFYMCIIIYGQFSAKATAKDMTKHLSPRKPKLCARKNRESRRESLYGLEPNRYSVFDAAHIFDLIQS